MTTRGDPLDRILKRAATWLGLELDEDILNALDAKERLARYHRSRMQAQPPHLEGPGRPIHPNPPPH